VNHRPYQFITTLLAILTLAACGGPKGSDSTLKTTVDTAKAAPMVKLISMESISRNHYHIATITRCGSVLVQPTELEGTISIYAKVEGGEWALQKTTNLLETQTANGTKLYKICANWSDNSYSNRVENQPKWLEEFAIHYKVGEREYWDNNNGNNYRIAHHDGMMLADEKTNVLLAHSKTYHANYGQIKFFGAIHLRNLSPKKIVKVRYTTDNWKSYKETEAFYSPSLYPSYSTPIPSPNSHGVEIWNFSTNLTNANESVSFAIMYQTEDGTVYWDNNFGENYTTPIE
jgi:hypothetical protein